MTGNPKHQIRNPKEVGIGKGINPKPLFVRENVVGYASGNGKRYDLEERTFRFAQDVRVFVKNLPRTIANIEDIKQLVRASGSVGANYIEANESLGAKDFIMKIKICRKEAKESQFFLRLMNVDDHDTSERDRLVQEADELTKIFGAIYRKSS